MAETPSAPSLREWVLVPREPDGAMKEAGSKAEIDTWNRKGKIFADSPGRTYRAMLDAAPTPPTTLTEAVAAARAETEAMATMLADCVAVLQQVPLNQLPGKVDMMLFSALDAPIRGDASRSQLAERATAIRDARDASARAEGVREGLERAATACRRVRGGGYLATPADCVRAVQNELDAIASWRVQIPAPPTTPGGRTDG